MRMPVYMPHTCTSAGARFTCRNCLSNYSSVRSKKLRTGLLETKNPLGDQIYCKQKFGFLENGPSREENWAEISSIQLEDPRHWQAFIQLKRLLRKIPLSNRLDKAPQYLVHTRNYFIMKWLIPSPPTCIIRQQMMTSYSTSFYKQNNWIIHKSFLYFWPVVRLQFKKKWWHHTFRCTK